MPDADKYEPGSEPTQTKQRRGFAASATGDDAGPDRRMIAEDTIQGTTSEEQPNLRGKPSKGSRLDPDS